MSRRTWLPWSYRSHVAGFLALIAVMATLSAIIVGSLLSRGAVVRDLTRSEYDLAVTLLQLDRETGMTAEDFLPVLQSANLRAYFVGQDDPQLHAMVSTLGNADMTCVEGAQGWPVTLVRTSAGLVCIQPAADHELYASSLTRLLSVSLMTMAAFVLASLFGAKRISRPVTELTEATRHISRGDFSVRVSEEEPGEVGDLMHAFNSMTGALERQAAVQKDFIAAASHEFRTPIATIRGHAKLLAMDGLDPLEQEESVRAIASESERLARLADTLLRLSALEGRRPESVLERYRLDEQVRQTIVRLQSAWQDRAIGWDLDLQEVWVTSDRALLEQVWTNLMQNAIKFSADGQTVRISTWAERQEAAFRIEDRGIGMTQETIQHIFDRFYQADPSRASEGVGLGLSLVRRILDILGGQISVTSQPGCGSVFLVTLPLIPVKGERAHE